MNICRNKGKGECTETMNTRTYTMLRDGAYIVSILLCLVSFLVNVNGHEIGHDENRLLGAPLKTKPLFLIKLHIWSRQNGLLS